MFKTILFLSALALGLGGCEPGFAQSGSSNSQRVQGVPGNLGDPVKTTSYNTLVEIVTLTASITGGVFCNLQGYTGS